MAYDLREFMRQVESTVLKHAIKPGHYLRWTLNDKDQGQINPYGCADACNLLYTIGAFQRIQDSREAHIKALQSLQDPKSGLFHEDTHHEIHTTAHCLAALELFDCHGQHRLAGFDQWRTTDSLADFLDKLDWVNNPWNASHKGAGIYAAMVLNNEASEEWSQAYFNWLWQEVCPETGYWRRDTVRMVAQSPDDRGAFPYLAGSFHYLFNLEYAHQPLRYPQVMIDSGLQMWNEQLWPGLGKNIGFAEIDWVFCLTRALYQCHHRYDESMQALNDFSALYIPYLLSLDFKTDVQLDDLHALFGCLCCIAELQQALPGTILTDVPLKLVLDRRPFI